MIECIIPILRIKNLAASLRFYVDTLGFKKQWGDGTFASVGRGKASLMLAEKMQGKPGTWVWIGGNVPRLLAEWKSRGATTTGRPRNYPWAYEIKIKDPDGHVLRFGCDRKKNQPLEPWDPVIYVLKTRKPRNPRKPQKPRSKSRRR